MDGRVLGACYRGHRVMNRGELESFEVASKGQLTLTSTLFF
jgi:hypothetical protein